MKLVFVTEARFTKDLRGNIYGDMLKNTLLMRILMNLRWLYIIPSHGNIWEVFAKGVE